MSANNDIRMKLGHFALAASLSLSSCAQEAPPPQLVQTCSFKKKPAHMTREQKDRITDLIIEQETIREQIDKRPEDIQEDVFHDIEEMCARYSMSCVDKIKTKRNRITFSPEFDKCRQRPPGLRTACEDSLMPKTDPEGTITYLEISNECGRKYLECVNQNSSNYESQL